MGALVAPGATFPVLKAPPSAVAVWVRLSAFCQETVCPTFTVAGFAENELLKFMLRIITTTSGVPPAGGVVVVGVVVGVEYELPPPPQPASEEITNSNKDMADRRYMGSSP